MKTQPTSRQRASLPVTILPPRAIINNELSPLLDEIFAQQLASDQQPHPRVLTKILERVASSIESDADKITTRARRVASIEVAKGVSLKTLFQSGSNTPRPGEPQRVCLLEFQAGARLNLGDAQTSLSNSVDREWLVVKGDLVLNQEQLVDRDYKLMPRHFGAYSCESLNGATVLIRESVQATPMAEQPISSLDAFDNWPEYAPGIRRRILWQRDGQAAMLYLTEPNAAVPHHDHHHDEECFMVQGELYLDDTLLMEGDYQLAKARSQHAVTRTDTGVVLFAHGDVDLRFV